MTVPNENGLPMRLQGKITRWNDQRGFGFITQNGDDKAVFVHISAFDDHQRRPQPGDIVSDELNTDPQHRQRADNVRFVSPASSRSHLRRPDRPPRRLRGTVLGILLIGLLVYTLSWRTAPAPTPDNSQHLDTPTAQGFQCSSKRLCSQMTSCDEATFYLKYCPGVEIDGDHDGIPCEQQLCGH